MDQWGGILRLNVYIEALTLKELTSGLCAECIVLPVCEISSFLPLCQLCVPETGQAIAETGGLLILGDPPTRPLRGFNCHWLHSLIHFPLKEFCLWLYFTFLA